MKDVLRAGFNSHKTMGGKFRFLKEVLSGCELDDLRQIWLIEAAQKAFVEQAKRSPETALARAFNGHFAPRPLIADYSESLRKMMAILAEILRSSIADIKGSGVEDTIRFAVMAHNYNPGDARAVALIKACVAAFNRDEIDRARRFLTGAEVETEETRIAFGEARKKAASKTMMSLEAVRDSLLNISKSGPGQFDERARERTKAFIAELDRLLREPKDPEGQICRAARVWLQSNLDHWMIPDSVNIE